MVDIKNILGGGKFQDSCRRDKNSGELVCSRQLVNKDGTAVDVAGFKASTTADCQVVVTEAYENQTGALDHLEKKFLPKVTAKCNKTGRNVPTEI